MSTVPDYSGKQDVPFVDLGFGPYIHEATAKRFPVYTRGNAGEVWPEVAYPLTLSLARFAGDPAAGAMRHTGMVSEEELLAGGQQLLSGCYQGYMYLNLSFFRVIAVRTPGTSIEDNDATYLGTEGAAPPYVAQKGDRSLKASINAARMGIKMLNTTSLPLLEDNQRKLQRLRSGQPNVQDATEQELMAFLMSAMEPAMEMFTDHLVISGQAGGAMQLLAQTCEDRLGDRSLVLTLLAGLGEVASAAPSFALWDLGRIVADSPALMTQFDAGVQGLPERLATDAAAQHFNAQLAQFMATFGSRGPNEWDAAAHTWETQPELVLALVDRMRLSDQANDPNVMHTALVAKREQATADARAQLKGPAKWMFNKALAAASLFSPAREQSKTTVIGAIHLNRLVSHEFGKRMAAKTAEGQWDDVWFVVGSELGDYMADPAAFADVIASRRATRDELAKRVPPFVFSGQMPSPDTWPLRDHVDPNLVPLLSGQSITGLGGCPGVAEGIARVITDITDPGDLGPGDVLIAPLTDPAWTPLFVPAEAVVVDVGGQMSHAVIVSRELGKPCVVAATDATKRIPNGARVRVDGTNGTVTVLEEPA